MKKTKLFKSSCNCAKCQDMCENVCYFGPRDAMKAMDAGMANRMVSYVDYIDECYNHVTVLHPREDYIGRNYRCTFRCYNQCAIHNTNYKPLEAILASCENSNSGLRERIVNLWTKPQGIRALKRWRELVNE